MSLFPGFGRLSWLVVAILVCAVFAASNETASPYGGFHPQDLSDITALIEGIVVDWASKYEKLANSSWMDPVYLDEIRNAKTTEVSCNYDGNPHTAWINSKNGSIPLDMSCMADRRITRRSLDLVNDTSEDPSPEEIRQWEWNNMDPILRSMFDVSDEEVKGLNITDGGYFAFTKENRDQSYVDIWYPAYTQYLHRRPEFAINGETKQFAIDFLGNPNFDCSLGYRVCYDRPSLYDIQRRYPGLSNRPLVRRIYFHVLQLDMYTREINANLESFTNLLVYLQSKVPAMVRDFTQQLNGGAAQKCKMFHWMIEQVVSVAIQVGSMGVGQVLNPMLQPGGAFFDLVLSQQSYEGLLSKPLESWNAKSQKMLMNMKPGQTKWGFGIDGPAYKGREFELVNYFTEQTLGGIQERVRGEIAGAGGSIDTGGRRIDGGMAHGWICSDFGGDWDNDLLNPKNYERLKDFINEEFADARSKTQATFEALLKGIYGGPDDLSGLAKFLYGSDVTFGPRGMMASLSNRAFEELSMKSSMIRELISGILADGQNYIKCTWDPEALKKCAPIPLPSGGTADPMHFCPRPERDPHLLCLPARWYTADLDAHETYFNGLNNLKKWDLAGLSRNQILTEAFENYANYGNTNETVDWSKWALSNGRSGSYRLPVCFSKDHNEFQIPYKGTDHKGSHNTYRFPSTCGDHHSSETESFMSAVGLGPESNLFESRYPLPHPVANNLWRDRIPRQLYKLQPYNRYMAMCKNYIHLPFHGDGFHGIELFRVRQGQDVECGMVLNYTQSLNEYDSNKAFCENQMGHTVFKRERKSFEMPDPPVKWGKNHKSACKAWLKDNKA